MGLQKIDETLVDENELDRIQTFNGVIGTLVNFVRDCFEMKLFVRGRYIDFQEWESIAVAKFNEAYNAYTKKPAEEVGEYAVFNTYLTTCLSNYISRKKEEMYNHSQKLQVVNENVTYVKDLIDEFNQIVPDMDGFAESFGKFLSDVGAVKERSYFIKIYKEKALNGISMEARKVLNLSLMRYYKKFLGIEL